MAKKLTRDATAKAEKPTPPTPDVTSEKAEPIPSVPPRWTSLILTRAHQTIRLKADPVKAPVERAFAMSIPWKNK